jgi:hypothetical protein
MANTKKVIDITWSPSLAYCVGLIATDGNLSPDARHISFTSKDLVLAHILKRTFKLQNKIGKKTRGGSTEKKYYIVQFGAVDFYQFLLSIGLTPAKSKTLQRLLVPREFFAHFLRGCIDGDGNISEFTHPQSKVLQLRVRLTSASRGFLEWIQSEIGSLVHTEGGWIYQDKKKSTLTLSYATSDAIKILRFMYTGCSEDFLPRKRKTAKKYLVIE